MALSSRAKPIESISSASSRTKHADVRRVERAAAQVIEHAARRADDDLRARLRAPRSACPSARRRRSATTLMPRYLPSRSSSRATCSASSRVGERMSACTLRLRALHERVDDREAERGRLAGAGAGLHDEALAARGGLEDGALHRRRVRVAELVDGLAHLGAERKDVEGRRGGGALFRRRWLRSPGSSGVTHL